jgi:hypothetical protein
VTTPTLLVGLDLVDAGDDPSDGRQRRNERQFFAAPAPRLGKCAKPRNFRWIRPEISSRSLSLMAEVPCPFFRRYNSKARPVARDKLKFVPRQLYASRDGRRRRGNAVGSQRMTTSTTSPKTTALLRQPSIPAARYGWS